MSIPQVAEPFNYDAAKRILAATDDPVSANLMKYALAQLQLQLLPIAGVDEDEWRRNLPLAPFDMAFFLKVIKSMFANREVVDKLLAGQTTAQATGWDIFG